MKPLVRALVVALTLLAGGCLSYEENQIRYTSADHRSGQIKEWNKPTVEIPLSLPSFAQKETKPSPAGPLRQSDADLIETSDGSSSAAPSPQTSAHIKDALSDDTSLFPTSAP